MEKTNKIINTGTPSSELKVRSIRATEETYEKFKELSSQFGSQSDCLSNLITAYELNLAKNVITNMQTDVSDFEAHIEAISKAFIHIIELNENTEQRIRQEFADTLTSKDKVIFGLQERAETAEQLAEQIKQECTGQLQNYDEELTELKKEISEVKENLEIKTKECSQYEKSLTDKQMIIDSLNARLPEQAESEKKIAELQQKLENAYKNCTEKENEISELSDKLKNAISQAEIFKKTSEAEIKAVIYDTKAEQQKTIDSIKEKYQQKIDEYNEKIERLNEKNEKLQNKINEFIEKSSCEANSKQSNPNKK